jgi:hypothetical protein
MPGTNTLTDEERDLGRAADGHWLVDSGCLNLFKASVTPDRDRLVRGRELRCPRVGRRGREVPGEVIRYH